MREKINVNDLYIMVFEELAAKQPFYCVCGKRAGGPHVRICREFNKIVQQETQRRVCQM